MAHYIQVIFINNLLFLKKGGWVMFPLSIFFISSIIIGISRWIFFQFLLKFSKKATKDIQKTLKTNFLEQLQKENMPSNQCIAFEDLLDTAYLHQQKDSLAFESALEACAQYWITKSQRFLNLLDFFITASPLLGLLGTIFGMIDAFKILDQTLLTSHTLSSGIAEALIATGTGLFVALFCLSMHAFFSAQMESLTQSLEWIATMCQKHYYSLPSVQKITSIAKEPPSSYL